MHACMCVCVCVCVQCVFVFIQSFIYLFIYLRIYTYEINWNYMSTKIDKDELHSSYQPCWPRIPNWDALHSPILFTNPVSTKGSGGSPLGPRHHRHHPKTWMVDLNPKGVLLVVAPLVYNYPLVNIQKTMENHHV